VHYYWLAFRSNTKHHRPLLGNRYCTGSRGKNPVSFPTLSVRGSTMRTWILPESLNLDALLIDDTTSSKSNKKATMMNTGAGGTGGGRSIGRGRGRGGGRR
jgi:small nuclear ribonucleoprotein D1